MSEKRCDITGNPCGTDTWNVGNPPDCRCGRIERLQAELREVQELFQEAREGLSNEKEHSQFMEKLLAARHGEGWQSLAIDRAKHTRESAERLLQERDRELEQCAYDKADLVKEIELLQMQMAGLVDILQGIASPAEIKDFGWWTEHARKALANLPDVSKYRRLMEAVSYLRKAKCENDICDAEVELIAAANELEPSER